MHTTPLIGLAGGIGSGKTAVAKMLADLGCHVSDSDAAARASLDDPEVRRRIIKAFGEKVLVHSRPVQQGERPTSIDRSALASIVFADSEKKRLLESIIHPWVEARRKEQFAAAPPDAKAYVIDAPLLFEAGLDRECDAVIFVDAPRELRLARVRESRGWDEAELDRREASQMPLDEKRRRADHVLINTGSLDELAEQTRGVLATIVRAHGSR